MNRHPDDLTLDDLLYRWHAWSQTDDPGRGYNRRALVCGDFRISRQYDDCNGQLDADVDKAQVHAVEFAVRQMAEPWRWAIYANARAIYTGAAVWSHPRVPREDQQRVTFEARAMLTTRLHAAGVM